MSGVMKTVTWNLQKPWGTVVNWTLEKAKNKKTMHSTDFIAWMDTFPDSTSCTSELTHKQENRKFPEEAVANYGFPEIIIFEPWDGKRTGAQVNMSDSWSYKPTLLPLHVAIPGTKTFKSYWSISNFQNIFNVIFNNFQNKLTRSYNKTNTVSEWSES